MNYKIVKSKGDIRIGKLYAHRYLIGRKLESNDKPIPLLSYSVSRVRSALIHINKLYFIIKGALLGNRKKRHFLICEKLFTGALEYKALGNCVICNG